MRERNTHHIIPRSREGETFKTNTSVNFIQLDIKLHENLHRLFENKTPQEQLRLILSINSQVINPQTTKDLYEILSQEIDVFYVHQVLRFIL